MTHRRVQNHIQAQIEKAAGVVAPTSLPIKLTVESTNACNLRCVACPTGNEHIGRRPGHLSIELFSWLMRELGPTLFEVELHNWGEPLLGRHVFSFIEMASAAGVSTTVSTNFSIPFDDERAERLVTSGLAVLGASIDGATQDAYEKYRVRGDLDLVLENCRRVARAKRRLGSPTPELFWSFRVFPHNVHEVDIARGIAEEIGMKFVATRGWVLGPASEGLDVFRYPWGEGFPDRCHFLWLQAAVHHDGGVAPCCCTFWAEDDFERLDVRPESLEETSFRSVWNSPRFIAARNLFKDRRSVTEEDRRLACYECPETKDFEGWREAIRTGAQEFRKTSSNDLYNYFMGRRPEAGPNLVQIRRR